MFDATRNVKLSEVFTCKTNCNNGTESTTNASRTLEAKQNIKGNARPKAPRNIAEEPAEEDPDAPKELTIGQKKQIHFTFEQLKNQELEIDAHIKLGSHTLIKDLTLPYIARTLTLQKSACALYAAQLDHSLDRGTLIGTITE